jgi:hypothetical protein
LPVCTASAAGAARHAGLLAEEVHLDTPAGDIEVTDQDHNLAGPQPLSQDAERAARSPAGRQHLHAKSLTEGDEPLVDRLGLQPLRHSGNRARSTGDDPRAGLVIVPHMRQREHHPAARRYILKCCLEMPAVVHPARQPLGRHHRQPENLQPVPRVGPHCLPGQCPQLPVRLFTADDPAQVALQDLDPGTPPAPGNVSGEPEALPRPGLGQAAGN